MDFAVDILKTCEKIHKHYSLVNQLERSATSIGANLHEAQYAHSIADLIAKQEIALKETSETQYWLELFVRVGMIEREQAVPLYRKCGTIRRLLIASLATLKENTE